MGQHINKCAECNTYTLKDKCSYCQNKIINPRPARFSMEDRYGKYRRLLKEQLKKV
ncbi:MAG: RNA-protein complex protein Nop10 [Methanosarcinales archaeon]|nr:RNA-protein complex protein Nop10 [Methanosarcinales archaeon]